MGEIDPKKLEEMLRAAIPPEHRQFADKILADHGVPKLPEGEQPVGELLGWTAATATPQVEVALRHPKVRLIANALGTPPDRRDRADPRLAAGSSPRSAARRSRRCAHKAAGVDIIIAQGTEGGGHTGEIGSVVLWPEVIDAVAPTPVLAAGGIGTGRQIAAALAMGAQGVWTGSLWLTVQEADAPPAQIESLPRRDQQGHGALALVDRQAVPHAAQRLDRGVGGARRRRSRSACRCSSWSPPTPSRAATATPTRRRT